MLLFSAICWRKKDIVKKFVDKIPRQESIVGQFSRFNTWQIKVLHHNDTKLTKIQYSLWSKLLNVLTQPEILKGFLLWYK